jgi:hypothetical protein
MSLGVPLPALDEDDTAPITLDDEKALAPLVAAAAQRTLVMNQAMAAQQAAQQQAQNPELQIAQAELQLKERDSQRKAKNDEMDFIVAQERLRLDRERLASENRKATMKTVMDKQSKDADRAVKVIQASRPRPVPNRNGNPGS